MKKFLFFFLLLTPLLLNGQANINWAFPSEPTFHQIKTRANAYFDSLALTRKSMQGTGYQYYKRWEWFWENRLGKTGTFTQARDAVRSYYSDASSRTSSCEGSSWTELGPTVFPGGAGGNYGYQRGIGQMTFVRFHPQYNGGTEQTVYTGGPSGLWKSTNDGVSWSVLNTDKNQLTSCADLAIDPQFPTTMYLATGEEKSNSLFSPFGTSYEESYGILKTTDGGANWTNIGPNFNSYSDLQYTSVKIGRLRLHPANRNILYLVVYYHSWNNGSHWEGKIFKSINGGTSWNIIYNATNTHLLDIEFKPNDANMFYAAGFRLLRFTDTQSNTGLLTPTDITGQLGSGWPATSDPAFIPAGGHAIRLEIEVTPAAPDNLYAIGCKVPPAQFSDGFENLWVSTNAWGGSPTLTAKNPQGTSGSYNNGLAISRQMSSLAVSPLNANEIFMGGIALGRSTDGGSNFTKLNNGSTIHPDNRELECVQTGSSVRLFTCNDAGIYVSTDNGTTWLTRCSGLGVARAYSVDVSFTPNSGSSDKVITGLQDCTTLIKDPSGWFRPSDVGGDGMTVAIDPTNDNIMYRESQGGSISKSTDGLNFPLGSVNSPGSGLWVTPYMLDPNNHHKLVVGKRDLQIIDFTSGGSGVLTTKTIAQKPTDTNIKISAVAVAPSNSNVMVVGYNYGMIVSGYQVNRQLFLTTDGGTNWTDITPTSFSHINAPVKSIIIHPSNPQKIWIALGAYDWESTHAKVLVSTNSGTSWTNYMNGLPFMPCNSMVLNLNRLEDEEMYIGMDVGVYYRNRFMSEWQCYTGVLPNVAVNELKVNNNKKMLFAATFGRGIWKTPFFCPTTPSYTLATSPLDFYAATTFITSTSAIGTNRKVAYRAPTITLNPGFSVASGSEFTAFAYSCAAFTPRDEDPAEGEENGEDIAVPLETASDMDLRVYPIPARDEIVLEYVLKATDNVAIFVADAQGRYVKHLFRGAGEQAGDYYKVFQLDGVEPGIYFITLQTKSGTLSKTLIVEK